MAAAAQPCREDELTPSTTPSTARTTACCGPAPRAPQHCATLLAMMIVLDSTIVAVAVPAIQTRPRLLRPPGVAWVRQRLS